MKKVNINLILSLIIILTLFDVTVFCFFLSGKVDSELLETTGSSIESTLQQDEIDDVEGCYVPCDWKKDFTKEYLDQIKYYCLVMTKEYIENHFADIKAHANDIEKRLDDSDCTVGKMVKENENALRMCKEWGNDYILIDGKYEVEENL